MRRPLPLLLAFLLPAPAFAKDLRGHLGLGFESVIGDVSTLSARYVLPTESPGAQVWLEIDLGAGWTSGQTPDLYGGGRIGFAVVTEDNMNVFLSVAGGYDYAPSGSFGRITPAAGAEFFFFGLENLGIGAQIGANVDLAASPGVHLAPSLSARYYF